ncbi:Peroxidase 3 [Bienertia sinuspersici]
MKMGYANMMIILGIIAIIGFTEAQLMPNYYAHSCPRAEEIVQGFVHQHIPNAPSLAAPLLRMQFHDCFVRGCDASVLLNITKAGNNDTEKLANPNLTLRGFDFIDGVKSLLEAECPGVVSCADIIALVARDAVVTIGGPWWPVTTGRRDGMFSNESEALQNIPPPTSNFSSLQTIFASKGLDLKDLVLLSGAHTIGISICPSFLNDYTTSLAMGTAKTHHSTVSTQPTSSQENARRLPTTQP